MLFDDAVLRSDPLALAIERLLEPLIDKLSARGEALRELTIDFAFDHFPTRTESIRPATPTLDTSQLLGLVCLRLECVVLDEGVSELSIEVHGSPIALEQSELFAERPSRDRQAGNRALAQLRARYGERAVVRAALCAKHLPEARFEWRRFDRLETPHKESGPSSAYRHSTPLIRRYFEPPIALAHRARREPDGWILGNPKAGSVTRLHGPYVISGAWWRRLVHREYYFAETRNGGIYWVYYDRRRRRWFLHGTIA